MKMTEMNRANAKILRAALDAAVHKVGEEYGLQIQTKNGIFTESNFTVKVECAVIGESGIVFTKEAEDYVSHCDIWGLKADYLGEVFLDQNGSEYKVTGAKPRSQKYPIVVKRLSDGASYKFPANRVKRAFDRKEVA